MTATVDESAPSPCPTCCGPRTVTPSGYVRCSPCNSARIRAWRYRTAALLGRAEPVYRSPAEADEAARRVRIYERRFADIVALVPFEDDDVPGLTIFDRLRPVDDFAADDPYELCDACRTPKALVSNGRGRMKLECPRCAREVRRAQRSEAG